MAMHSHMIQREIEMGVTLMNTKPGFNRCIRVGTAFDKLPEGFMILFSHWSITDVPCTSGIPHKYQVSLPHNKNYTCNHIRIELRPKE